MLSKHLTLLLVVVGMVCLVSSMLPTLRISRYYRGQRQAAAWLILAGLITFFLFGYLAFGLLVRGRETASFLEIIVSFILAGGGFFVLLLVRLSLASIDHLKRAAEKERYRALHDELTELPNRTLLHERIDHAILTAKRDQRPVAVLMMDLDHFKEINDTLGHYYGDYLLQLVAPRLRRSIRESDTIARLGGDEFAVVLPGVDLETAMGVADKIVRAMEQPFMIEGQDLKLDISIGIALYPQHGIESETLLQRADVAMYVAKRKKIGYTIYDVEHDQNSLKRLMLTSELRDAIRKDQLVLHYQPKITLQNLEICGVEVLARWRHQESGQLIYPDQFIGIAEKTGMIRDLTLWVLNRSFAQFASWREQGLLLPLSVNLSLKNLHDQHFPQQLAGLIKKWQIPPAALTLEITESCMLQEPDRFLETINAIREMGITLSIDDFGTGYSSLACLKQVPASELKIDKSFVFNMSRDRHDLAIVRTTIDLARNMGLTVVAEGVEKQAMREVLLGLGCLTGQGNLFCPPLPAEELLKILQPPAGQGGRPEDPGANPAGNYRLSGELIVARSRMAAVS